MSAADLDAEFTAANDYGAPVIARLRKVGIPDDVIFGLRSRCGVAQVQADPDGLYQPHPEGRWMFVTPEGEPGDPSGWLALDDLVAFHTGEPTRWWLRLGSVDLLGTTHVEELRLLGGPLRLHSTPLAWLRAGADGAVVVNWQFDPNAVLGDIEAIICDSPLLARRLERRMQETAPQGPKILTGDVRHAA